MLPRRFTVRVYGFLINDNQQVLVLHERAEDFAFTKFPGGGLEMGEGPVDCVIREFKEETGLDVVVVRHVYTTDYFVQSRFDPEEQVIGIYYEVRAVDLVSGQKGEHKTSVMDLVNPENGVLPEWVTFSEMKGDLLSFEMDRRAWGRF